MRSLAVEHVRAISIIIPLSLPRYLRTIIVIGQQKNMIKVCMSAVQSHGSRVQVLLLPEKNILLEKNYSV